MKHSLFSWRRENKLGAPNIGNRISPLAVALISCVVAGCSTTPAPTWQIEPPSARLMTRPEALPVIVEGTDLYAENARLRLAYAREAGKVVSLQQYVRTVLKKPKGAPQ